MGCLCFSCPAPEFIFGATVLSSISSLLRKLQSVIQGALPCRWLPETYPSGLVDYLLRDRLLDDVATEGVSNFSLRQDAHVTDLVLLILVITTLVNE